MVVQSAYKVLKTHSSSSSAAFALTPFPFFFLTAFFLGEAPLGVAVFELTGRAGLFSGGQVGVGERTGGTGGRMVGWN